MRKSLFSLMLGALSLSAAHAQPANTITLAVYGDAPYGTSPTDTSEFDATPAFINNVNADPDVSLVLHVGDIHSGKQYCTEAYDRSIYDLWTAYRFPLVYTPGDNEWTDCHKSKEGGGSYDASTDQIVYRTDASGAPTDYAQGNPVANLDLVRSIFFADPGHTLGRDMRVTSQAQAWAYLADDADERHEHHRAAGPVPSDAKFVENVMWERGGVLFVTINVPGGSNNDTDAWYGTPNVSNEQAREVAERNGADLRWLDAAFARARAVHAKAVVIGLQADMWDLDGNPPSHIANYRPYIDSIAQHTLAFGKPVLLINGDSHTYRSDNPLVQGASCTTESGPATVACSDDAYANQAHGYDVPNFHRIVVHGNKMPLEWLKLSIDTSKNAPAGDTAFGPFSWQRMIQP